MKQGVQSFRSTKIACYTGYVTQAIVNNFAPLLFVIFQDKFAIPLSQITLLVTVNFFVQLLVDYLAARFIDRFGCRVPVVVAHVLSAVGVIGLGFFPRIFPSPFAGLLTAAVCYAVGGGLIEVLISPIIEACPSDNKSSGMSLLHSFYCWGTVFVVLVSTGLLAWFGKESFPLIACLWALVPIVNAVVFCFVPIVTPEKAEQGASVRELFKNRFFLIFLLLMLTAGAGEQSIAQWASAFAERGLGVSKAIGDVAGPCMFAVLMGITRTLYAIFANRLDLGKVVTWSGICCFASFLVISLSPSPVVSLIGVGISGLACGMFWPGITSLAAERFPKGGVTMFALLALTGDLGCSVGPTTVGLISGAFGDRLSVGLLAASIFPILLTVCVIISRKQKAGASARQQ